MKPYGAWNSRSILLTVLTGGLLGATCGPVRAELIGQWTFNESKGSTVEDTSGRNNDGFAAGGPAYGIAPRGAALYFDGINQSVDFGKTAALIPHYARSIVARVKINGPGMGSRPVMLLGQSEDSFGLAYGNDGGISFFFGGGRISCPVSSGAWHHVAGIAEPDGSGIRLRLYLDGVEVAGGVSETLPLPGWSLPLHSGTDVGQTSFFNGQINELKLFDHALTAAEVKADCRAGAIRTIYAGPQDDLKNLIESASGNTQILLAAGTYRVTCPILIADKKRLQVIGRGREASTLKADANMKGQVFTVGPGTETLVIQNLGISGTPPTPPASQEASGIGSHDYKNATIRDVTFRQLLIQEVAVGISIGCSVGNNSVFDRVTVADNLLINLRGTEAGHGYGIHSNEATHVAIVGNCIENAQRHAIYIGHAANDSNTLVKDNFILNHDREKRNPRPYCAAMEIARSSDVKLENNLIVNSEHYSIGIGGDDIAHLPIEKIIMVNNRVIGAGQVAFWGRSGSDIVNLGLQVIGRAGNPYPHYWDVFGGIPYRRSAFFVYSDNPDPRARDYRKPTRLVAPSARWNHWRLTTVQNGKVYVVHDNILDEVEPYNWNFRPAPGQDWDAVAGMGAMNGKLYLVKAASLLEIDPASWTIRTDPSPQWGGTSLVMATGNYVYIARENHLYRVNPADWSYRTIDSGPVQALYDWRDTPYCMLNDRQYRIEPDLSLVCIGNRDPS